jgi:hypothetical protein
MDYTIVVNITSGAIASLVICIGLWYSTKHTGTTAIDWAGVGAYAIVGAVIGGVGGYMGIPITVEWVTAQVLIYGAIIALVDNFLAGHLKLQSQSFMLKYTGHSYFPLFKMTLSDGTVETFNTETTGRCCCVGVAMQPQSWTPGFTVTPAFMDGTSPYTVALNIKTGRNSDLTTVPKMEVDWQDGSPIETIPLAIGKQGNPEGIARHTFIFKGN